MTKAEPAIAMATCSSTRRSRWRFRGTSSRSRARPNRYGTETAAAAPKRPTDAAFSAQACCPDTHGARHGRAQPDRARGRELFLPRILGWRSQIARLEPLTGECSPVTRHIGTNLCLAILTLAPDLLLDRSISRAVCRGHCTWGARLVIQFVWFRSVCRRQYAVPPISPDLAFGFWAELRRDPVRPVVT